MYKALPKRLRELLIPLAYLGLAVVMTWPLAADLGGRLGAGLDPPLQSWVLAWGAHALRTDPLGIWQAPIFYPYPDTLAYTDHHLALLPVAAPLIWATGNPALAQNVLALLSYALSGWAVYLLAADLVRDQDRTLSPLVIRLAAFVAGVGFAFSAFRMAQFVHLQMLQTAWLPLALLFLRRLLHGGGWRDAIGMGLFLALQCVTALYFSYLAALALGIYAGLWAAGALWARFRHRARLPWGIFMRLLGGGILAAAIVVPLTLPYLRVYQTLGIVRSARELENWSAPLQSYLAAAPDNVLYSGFGTLFEPSGGEFALFPGAVVGALALVGIWVGLYGGPAGREIRRLDTVALLLLASAALILSLGTVLRLTRGGDPLPIPLPYGLLYERLPGFGALRVPARWGVLVTLALCLLAAGGLAAIAGRLRGSGRVSLLTLAVLGVVLGESYAPIQLSRVPVLAEAPPVYTWLRDQPDARVVLELPTARNQRGAELDRTMRRQYYGILHWKRLAAGYSGLLPFGTADLLGRAQGLPDHDALRYLQLAGIDTLVVHRDEYEPDALEALLAGLDTSALVARRAELGEALVYALQPLDGIELPAGASVYLTGDERAPGVLALALARRWEAEGGRLYGPARVRYYGALGTLRPGQVADYALLAEGESPLPYGYVPAGEQWRAAGLVFYARDPGLRASLALGAPPFGRFHPASPPAIELIIGPTDATIGGREITWETPLTTAVVELDVASLAPQELSSGPDRIAVPAGVSTVSLAAPLGRTITIAGRRDETAILRVRVRETVVAPPTAGVMALEADSRFEGSRLTVDVRVGGAGTLLVVAQGASAADDRPIALFEGLQPVPPDGLGAWSFSVDLLQPSEPWLQQAGVAQDGRYIVYLKDAGQPEGPGLPIAKFNVRGGRIVDAEPVPLPLTELR